MGSSGIENVFWPLLRTRAATGNYEPLGSFAMMDAWTPLEANRYEDHVIAHVLGTTVLGYFTIEDAAYMLLDIGFVWTIYAGGEMALLPQPVTIKELAVDDSLKAELVADAERLYQGKPELLTLIHQAPVECLIQDVKIYTQEGRCRVVLEGEEANLMVEGATDADEPSVKVLISAG